MTSEPDPRDLLEPNQLTSALERPLPRREIGRGLFLLLLALRVYVFLAVPIVVYAFLKALHG